MEAAVSVFFSNMFNSEHNVQECHVRPAEPFGRATGLHSSMEARFKIKITD